MNLKHALDAQLVPLTGELIDAAISDAAAFRFDKTHPQQLASVCVYCTLLELARSTPTLLANEDVTAIPVVLRSIFEAYADLRATLGDPEYYKRMYSTLLEERLRFLRNVERSRSNPFLVSIAGQLDIAAEQASLQQELSDYKNGGHSPLTTAARFKAANLEHEYESMYWLLCLEGHNNMSALDDRHIGKSGDDFEVLMFKEPQPDDMVRLLDSLAAVVIDSTARMHKFLKTGVEGKYQSFSTRLTKIRANYLGPGHASQPSEG